MKTSPHFSPEVRERSVCLARAHQGEPELHWVGICSIATKIGCTAETRRRWRRQSEKDNGEHEGATPAGSDQGVGRAVRERRQANAILRTASASVASVLSACFKNKYC